MTDGTAQTRESRDVAETLVAEFREKMVKVKKQGEEEDPPYQHFVDHRFQLRTYKVVLQARDIINEYAKQGYTLTLRQLFYQFVSRDLMENTKAKYDSLGGIVKHARLNGMLPMWSIEDRTRSLSTWADDTGPEDALSGMVKNYRRDKWQDQEVRLEVWYEKDALAGIFEKACAKYEVPFASTRGYASLSQLKNAYERSNGLWGVSEHIRIAHFSDHDPSGTDMTRDIENRLNEDFGTFVDVERIALTMDQVEEYAPPPNFAKEKDSRFDAYVDEYGTTESWELDALTPQVLADLVQKQVDAVLDLDQWNKSLDREQEEREQLRKFAVTFEDGTR